MICVDSGLWLGISTIWLVMKLGKSAPGKHIAALRIPTKYSVNRNNFVPGITNRLDVLAFDGRSKISSIEE